VASTRDRPGILSLAGRTSQASRACGMEPVEHRATYRTGFLKTTGRGAALVAVAAGGLGTWRAIDQDVFSVGQGPAYAAWDDWRGRPGDGPLNLVRAAILAANAHDSQPWLFRLAPTHIDVHAVLTRNLGRLTRCGVRCISRSAAPWRTCSLPLRLMGTPSVSPSSPTLQIQLMSLAST
jgi:hypothetical protein